MADLIVHERTDQQLQRQLLQPAQSLVITGAAGIGKSALARWLAAQLLGIDDVVNYPYFTEIASPSGKQISIEAVRQLPGFLSRSVPANRAVNRIVLITDAHTLTEEAQNALLKTLEEPPQRTMIILTSITVQSLLPTIRSRLQELIVYRPNKDSLREALLATGLPASQSQQVLALSDGLPGLAFALAANNQDHPMVTAANSARQILQATLFTRLSLVDALSKNSDASRNTVAMLTRMSRAALLGTADGARWQKIMTASYHAERQLQAGSQTKLVLTNLMLRL